MIQKKKLLFYLKHASVLMAIPFVIADLLVFAKIYKFLVTALFWRRKIN